MARSGHAEQDLVEAVLLSEGKQELAPARWGILVQQIVNFDRGRHACLALLL
jgi:hypothetical protein